MINSLIDKFVGLPIIKLNNSGNTGIKSVKAKTFITDVVGTAKLSINLIKTFLNYLVFCIISS
jgi:hypothetical protein